MQFQFLDEYYRLLKVLMTNQQNTVDYTVMYKVSELYHMALNHYKEHINPVIKSHSTFSAPTRFSSPAFKSSTLSSELLKLMGDHRYVDNQQKENSELKLRV